MRSPENGEGNVVSLFGRREAQETSPIEGAVTAETELAFDEIMRRNKQNLDRLRRERSTANKSVLRSYRIKN